MRTGAEEKWAALSAAVLEIAPLVSVFSVACNFLHGFERQIRELLEANGHAAAMFVYVSHSPVGRCANRAIQPGAHLTGP